MTTKIKIIICASAVVIIAAIVYYFNTSTKTPEYALKIVEESIVNHDKENFYKYVDLESVLETSYEGIIEGMMHSNKTMDDDARESVKDFTEMLRAPMLLSLQTSIDSYVETGDFHEEDNVGVAELLKRTGMNKSEFRGVRNVEIDSADDELATADILIYHPELDGEFTLKFVLTKTGSDNWKVVRVENFKEFITQINQVRLKSLDEYLKQSEEINKRHDKIIADAEQKYKAIKAAGSLAQDRTRINLRDLMSNVIKKDWEARKIEFLKLTVPKDAETLQNLRLKICDLEISYAEGMALWMDDKRALTIKTAEEKHRQAQTLKSEEKNWVRKMSN